MKKTVKILLLLFILISIPIIIRGIRRYGNNWIDISKDPSICYYDGNVYYEISNAEYLGIKGDEFEYMDKYIVNGAKANLLVYYLPTILTYRVGEMKGVGLLGGKICKDHVHMQVSIPPKQSISEFMSYFKGKSALMFYDRHPELRPKYGDRHLWAM